MEEKSIITPVVFLNIFTYSTSGEIKVLVHKGTLPNGEIAQKNENIVRVANALLYRLLKINCIEFNGWVALKACKPFVLDDLLVLAYAVTIPEYEQVTVKDSEWISIGRLEGAADSISYKVNKTVLGEFLC